MFDIGEGLNIADNVLAKRRHYFSAGKLIDGETGLLTIGKDCAISPGTQIDYTGKVTIGNNAEISGNVLILSHQHPSNPKLRRKITIPLIVEIGDNAWLGERCVLVPSKKTGGLKIGENAIVAAGAVVTKDVPDNMIVGGNPAVIISQQERS
jgi:acetyltransferase-like isoleucine patch superfamily enzyme